MSGWNWDQETPHETVVVGEKQREENKIHILWNYGALLIDLFWEINVKVKINKKIKRLKKFVYTNMNKWYYNNWHEWKMVPWKSEALYWGRRDRDWKERRGIPEEQWVIKIGDWIESAEQRGCPLNSERERERERKREKTENM